MNNFDWLNNDKEMMGSLTGLASLDDSAIGENSAINAGADILEYLLQEAANNNPSSSSKNNSQAHIVKDNFVQALTQQQQQQQQAQEPKTNDAPTMTETVAAETLFADNSYKSAISVVQGKDNFVTFTPVSTPTKKPPTTKKTKFKAPIFVTESPQNAYGKKKKSKSSTNQHSSAEENSDDDMLLDEELASSTTPSQLKQMTSKERRQLRNKISARNFRVRRKEYITQLEERVEEHENTIEELKRENAILRKANDEFTKQILTQPITPPTSSSDELLSSSSTSSGSEGHQSPERAIPNMFQFQLNDLYDFNLFDQQQTHQQQQLQPMDEVANLFYLNHAVIPDFDFSRVLNEKGQPITNEEHQREITRELISDYPLLAPALMSIVLRHTLSLEYVSALAKEFTDSLSLENNDDTKKTDVMDDIQKRVDKLQLENKDQQDALKEEEKKEYELTKLMLAHYFPSYALMRARGYSHQDIVQKSKKCMLHAEEKRKAKEAKKRAKELTKKSSANTFDTLHTYCKVAGTLLKHPHRMTHINKVLKEQINFSHHNSLTSAKIEGLPASTKNCLSHRIIGSLQ